MSQISKSDGNSSRAIDYKKVLLAHGETWTLKSLGIELEKSVKPTKTSFEKALKKRRKVKK